MQVGDRIAFWFHPGGRDRPFITAGDIRSIDGSNITVGNVADWSRRVVLTIPASSVVQRKRKRRIRHA